MEDWAHQQLHSDQALLVWGPPLLTKPAKAVFALKGKQSFVQRILLPLALKISIAMITA